MKVVLSLLLVGLTLAVPTNFDLRVQTERARFTNYDLQPEGICAGYAWAKEIAQVVSNAVGMYQSQMIELSAQQMLDCTQTDTDLCYKVTLEQIKDAIQRVTLEGITLQECYPNKPFSYPNGFCKRECQDGSPFEFVYFPTFTRFTNFSDVVSQFKSRQNIAVMAVLKVDQAFNYYSAFNPVLTQGGPTSFYEFRVAEVLGWKNSQSKVILRAGPGQQWGYSGFIDLQLSIYGKYITEYYVVDVSDRTSLTTE